MSNKLTSATQILALHGFTGEGADYSALSSSTGGTWHCPDLPGHGKNADVGAEDFSLERITSSLLHSTPIPRIGVGYSMGGRLLLHLAVRNPTAFQKLVLISASPGLRTAAERTTRIQSDEKWIQILKSEGIPHFFEKWWNQPVLQSLQNLPRTKRESLLQQRNQNSSAGLARSLQLHGTGKLPSLWSELQQIKLPILLCVGENDPKFQQIADNMLTALPSARKATIPKAGHAPHLENPTALSSEIRQFLA